MAKWINHVALLAPRNATTTHTVDPSTGTVGNGTLFTPTAGNLLVCMAEGSVTATTPSGWTLPTGGSAVNNTGLYVWWRTAAGGGGDTFTTTHNGSNYPEVFDYYEFPSGSTFGTSVAATGVSNTGAGPTLSGLTGTNLLIAVGAQGTTSTLSTVSWSSGTELVETGATGSPTDGYTYSMAYLEDSVLTSWSSAATFTGSTTIVERLVFSVKAVAGGAPAIPAPLIMQTRRAY